jgi:hypothetical protein
MSRSSKWFLPWASLIKILYAFLMYHVCYMSYPPYKNFTSSLLSSVGACAFRIIIPHQQPLRILQQWRFKLRDIQCPIINKFYPLNCWHDSLMYKTACPWVIIRIPIGKYIIICWLTNPLSYVTSCTATRPSYTLPFYLILFSVNLPYKDSQCSMFPYLISIFCCLGCSKESIQFRGSV